MTTCDWGLLNDKDSISRPTANRHGVGTRVVISKTTCIYPVLENLPKELHFRTTASYLIRTSPEIISS